MIDVSQLTDADYEKMALEIQKIASDQSEESLFRTIGNALHDSGLTVSLTDSSELLSPKSYSEASEKFNMIKSFSFVSDTTALSSDDAKEEGKKFWNRFKNNLRQTICENEKILELFNGDGTLIDYLKAGIPLVIAALGLAVLNPLWLAIIAAAIALIAKVGFNAYCEV